MKRLYARLFLWFFIANVATLILTAFVTQRIARTMYEQSQPDWANLTQRAVALYRGGGPAALRPWAERLRRHGLEIRLLAEGRDVLGSPLPPPLARHLPALTAAPEVVLHPRPGLTLIGFQPRGAQGLQFLALRRPPGPHPWLLLPVAVEIAVSVLVIAVIGWFSARGIAQPVAAVQAAARRVAGGELAARVGTPLTENRGELGQLARDFDRMAERIQALVERTRGLLQDISHELRSPLARLQLALELARRSGEAGGAHLAQAEVEIERIDRLLGEVLALTRMETGMPERLDQSVPLAELIRERVAAAAAAATPGRVKLGLSCTPLTVNGQRELLARAIDNLLSNAIKFSPAGGEVSVALRRAGDAAELTVADRGPGVTSAELGRIFEPFFRGRNAGHTDGQGLGLAIVERVARAHGGRLEARNRDGGGLVVTLRLPLADAGGGLKSAA